MNRQKIILTLFVACLISMLLPVPSQGRETIVMFLGEVQVMEIDKIERVAIGNPSIASNSILPQGQLVLLADSVGATTMHIWLKDGTEKDFDIIVNEKQYFDDYQELETLLQDIPGTTASRVGELVIVKGKIHMKDKSQYDRILSKYAEVLDLVTSRDIRSELSLLLEDIPNLRIREAAGFYVLSGEISEESSKLIAIVMNKYQDENIMNLTKVHTAVAGNMVYMKVRIVEMDKNVTENLGINWDRVLDGPRIEFGVESTRNGATILNADNMNQKSLSKSGQKNLHSMTGFFGIATGISSKINLLEETGHAVVLAEPQLSTRSGGKANFHAGGEYPIPIISSTGDQTGVEYKKYGIMLNIEPTVDDKGNILAHVETEISNIDTSKNFGDYVGLLTRNTTTDVSIRKDETLVIAGLVQEIANKGYDNVKWLADIPLLGSLFRYKKYNNQRRELIIFITPHVYDASSPLNAKHIEQGEKIQMELSEIVKGEKLLD